ncbi:MULTISPECIES: hypothetical protein [Providencia]|uniref:hypothetical protein n=1 Tax=Providencia TaxID=586 RepID=UPI0008FB5FAC|nr:MULTISPECIES: hypothetical protein [unclassified Providencia]APC12882.1 hypothetical protein RB151_032240 [Providencia rettgeri]UYV42384.1 hypothetical protein NTP67_03775 [Providencia rettgeri]
MSTMLYKADGNVKIWGMSLQIVTVSDDEIEDYLNDGWHKNPKDTQILPEPEKKPATKKKAVKDADNNEG